MTRNLFIAGLLSVFLLSGCAPVTRKSGQSGDRELEALRAFAASSGRLRVQWGINIDNPAPYKKEFELAAQTGKFRVVRLWFWWRWIEPEQGKFDWSMMDEQVAYITAIEPAFHTMAATFQLLDVLPFSVSRLKQRLR